MDQPHIGASSANLSNQMAPLRVPDRFVPALSMLRDLDVPQYESLRTGIERATPTLRSSALAESICDGTGLDEDEICLLVEALTSLAGVRRVQDVSVEEVARRVAASPDLETAEGDRDAFVERVADLADSKPLRLLGKAVDLGSEHDHVFLDARILTDLRPIFGEEASEPPEGALLSHTLKLEFVHEEGQLGNFYLVLDEEDLETLDGLISRARHKAVSLKSTLEAAGLTYMGLES